MTYRRHTRSFLSVAAVPLLALSAYAAEVPDQLPDPNGKPGNVEKPNILFCLSDDQSWPHASAYGTKVIQTPIFDRIAKDGVLFNHAYCASPSCTPSRSAILTGQDIWRLGQGGQLFGTLPAEHPVYTDLLTASGYQVGYVDKGWAPGNVQAGGRTSDPVGKRCKSFEAFFGRRPAEELYDCRKDPFQMHNLAADPAYRSAKQGLSDRLTASLKTTGDPRETSQPILWDEWPYYGNNRWKTLPEDISP